MTKRFRGFTSPTSALLLAGLAIGHTAEASVITAQDVAMPVLQIVTATTGVSPFLDAFYSGTTGSTSPAGFYGRSLIPIFVDYSIDLETGQGEITRRAGDVTLMTVEGAPGAFRLTHHDYVAEDALDEPEGLWIISATDPSLLRIMRLESPIGTSVIDSDPFGRSQVLLAALGFLTDPLVTNAVARHYWTHDDSTTPDQTHTWGARTVALVATPGGHLRFHRCPLPFSPAVAQQAEG